LAVVALVWFGIGLLLIPTSLDPGTGVRELISIAIGLLFVAGVVRNWKPGETLRDLRLGWSIAFAATGVIGTWEVVTGNHLANFFGGIALDDYTKTLIASTFGNSNAYAVFLASGLPLMLSYMNEVSRPRAFRITLVLALGWWAFLLIHTGGRLSIAASIIGVIVWLAVTRGRGGRPLLVVILAVMGVVLIGGLGGALGNGLSDKITQFSVSAIVQSATASGASGNVRVNLTLQGLYTIGRTFGLGAGPGNFAAQVQAHQYLFDTGSDVNPHNGLVELAAQYGLVVLVLVLVALIRPISWAVRDLGDAQRFFYPSETSDRALSRLIIVSFAVMFLPLSLENSTLWANPYIWVTIAIFVSAAFTVEPADRVRHRESRRARRASRALRARNKRYSKAARSG
jgi:teichuronic acid biosynthesis protein TuaE